MSAASGRSSIALNFVQLSVGETAAIVFVVVGFSALFFGYPIVAELRMQGRTFGRRALGLRLVTNEGGPVRARHAVVRSLFQLIDLPLGIGVLVGVITPRTQRCGDLAAGTFVIREPKQGKAVGAVVFPSPPGYEGYISLLDVATLDDGAIRALAFVPAASARARSSDPRSAWPTGWRGRWPANCATHRRRRSARRCSSCASWPRISAGTAPHRPSGRATAGAAALIV